MVIYKFKCVYQIWKIYLNLWGHEYRNINLIFFCLLNSSKWPDSDKTQTCCVVPDSLGHECKECIRTTFAYKVGQSDPIVMKLNVWHHIPNVYTKFQIDISKHFEKSLGNSDWQMDRHNHGITEPFFTWVYKKRYQPSDSRYVSQICKFKKKRVKTVYECTKYLVYEKVIIE